MQLSRGMQLDQIWPLIKQSVGAWIDDYAPSMGAALAYYTIFSLAPLLLIVIAVAGLVFGQDAVRGEIVDQLGGVIGRDSANAVQGLLKSASEPKQGLLSSAIGIVLLLVGATTVFAELQSALDRIWRVPAARRTSGVWNLLRSRLLSFGLILGLGFLMLVSLVISAALSALGHWYGGFFRDWQVVLRILDMVVSLAMSALLFAMIYKAMPRARIAWSDVWIGAVVTAAMFEMGKLLIGLYLSEAGLTNGFGAAGSLVVLIVWVYYSAQIFLLGAEFTWVYARAHGSHVAHVRPHAHPASLEAPTGEPPPDTPARGEDVPVLLRP
jgi:membrane protein